MKILNAEYNNGCLTLQMWRGDAIKFLNSFKPGEYEIKKTQPRRTRDANAYAWALISEISRVVGAPKLDIYRAALSEIGGKSCVISIRSEAADAFTRTFINGHIGRSVDVIGGNEEYTDLLLTYGSSDFDGQQMAQLIDALIQDAHAVGVETLDDMRINSLIEDWETKHA